MNLRLPLHAIARQYGLIVTAEALATDLRNGGTTPDLYHAKRVPFAEIPPSFAEVTLDGGWLPSAGEGGVVRA